MRNFSCNPVSPWPAIVIAVLFLLLATTYSIVTPIFESPDELWHYPFVWHLARTGELPVQDPAQPQLWQQEGSQPPLYYALAALLTAAIPADDLPSLIYPNPHADIGRVTQDGNINIVVHTPQEAWPWQGAVLALHLARFFSVLLGTGTILAVYALGRVIGPEQPHLALLAMSFMAFNPMFIYISGSVNNDNLITLLASLTLWQLAVMVCGQNKGAEAEPSARQLSLWRCTALGVLVGLAALAKFSGLGLLGVAGLTLLGLGWQRRAWRTAILGNVVMTVMVVAIAGWWYWRNFVLYDDWTGTEIIVAMMGPRPVTPTARQFLAELPGLVRSFWGLFGYFSIPLPSPIYRLLNLILAIGLGGLAAAVILNRLRPGTRKPAPLPSNLGPAWPLLAGWLGLICLGLLQWTLRTPATQGRLLFPALGSLAVLWAAGWLILPRVCHPLPALSMLMLAWWVPWGVIAPAYARPAFIDSLPASATRLDVTIGETIQLLGYKTGISTVKPGETLPLTLYWSGKQPVSTDYSVFIHLLDENDVVVAQRNVLHGPGVYPTSQWQVDQPFGDTYVLDIPRTAFAPAQTRFEVGLYDHTTGVRLPVSSGGDNLRFGSITIQPRPGELPNPQQLQFEDHVTLVGYDLDHRLVTPGQQVVLTLYWQSEATPDRNYKVFVHLAADDTTGIAQHDSEPQNGAAPTSSWQPGQVIIDEHPLLIGTDAPPGVYKLIVGLYDGDTGRRLRLLNNNGHSVQADSITLNGIRVASP